MSTPELKIIDASGYLFRAFYGLPPMTAPDGTPVNAIYGFCQMLGKLAKQSAKQYLVVAIDAKGASFRNKIYPEYKANRQEPPKDLIPQFALMRESLIAFGLHTVEVAGFEADDLIATLAHQAHLDGTRVTIVSSDKDMMQLICDDEITLWDPMKNRIIDSAAVLDKFGVTPDRIIDVQALAGDSSDNVPGVPKIGSKTAAELINRFGDLETLLASTAEITQNKRRKNLEEFAELARISKQLVTLRSDVPLPLRWQDLRYIPPKAETLNAFFSRLGFRSLQKRLGEFLADQNTPEGASIASTTSLPEPDYHLVTNPAQLQDWISTAETAGVVGFDVETDSLDPIQAEWVGFSLALPDRRACYVPLAHRSEGLGLEIITNQCPLDQALPALKGLLENPGVLKVGQNIKFDAHICAKRGIKIAPIDDTLLMSFVLEAGRYPTEGHGLDRLAKRRL
ncbi:MAG: DNA polymerase I, partial [Alphaproteobacteria bacterium]|nr:DNA polymerase I [Alphaproteobacteria bacterium]